MTAYLLITGVFFVVFGGFALLNPLRAVAQPYSLEADAVDAKNYLRAGAGGVTLACAGLFIVAAIIPNLEFAGLLTAIVVFGGLLFGRLISVIVDGMPSTFVRVAGCGEALGFAFGVFWLLRAGS